MEETTDEMVARILREEEAAFQGSPRQKAIDEYWALPTKPKRHSQSEYQAFGPYGIHGSSREGMTRANEAYLARKAQEDAQKQRLANLHKAMPTVEFSGTPDAYKAFTDATRENIAYAQGNSNVLPRFTPVWRGSIPTAAKQVIKWQKGMNMPAELAKLQGEKQNV